MFNCFGTNTETNNDNVNPEEDERGFSTEPNTSSTAPEKPGKHLLAFWLLGFSNFFFYYILVIESLEFSVQFYSFFQLYVPCFILIFSIFISSYFR